MSTSKRDLSLSILAEAKATSDKAVCDKHGITLRTLQRWRKAQAASGGAQASKASAATPRATRRDKATMSPDVAGDKAPKAMGRPTKLTAELQGQIVSLLSDGVPVGVVCENVGLDHTTYRSWLRWGQDGQGKEPFATFSVAIARARSGAMIDMLQTAQLGDGKGVSNGPARCAQWTLERLFPKQFAPRLNVKIEEELETLLDVVERSCGAKDCGCYQAILEALAARDRGEEAPEDSGDPAQPVH